jgi:hypothetical protein
MTTPTPRQAALEVISCHDHGNCELCDQLDRDLADARAAIREAAAMLACHSGYQVEAWLALSAVSQALKEPPHAD